MELARVTVPPTLDGASLTMFRRALAAACRGDECRVLVVEGSDSEFCRGLDFAALSEASSGDVGEATHLFARCLTELRSAGMPTIAAVGGATIGGGVGLAAACDMVLASERATFALPELLFGLLPATVLPLLYERMPAQKARLMALGGRSYSAEEARALGLADDVVPTEDLERAVRRAARLRARARPGTSDAFKRYAIDAAHLEPDDAIRTGAALTADRLHDASVVAGLRQFVRDNIPPWLMT